MSPPVAPSPGDAATVPAAWSGGLRLRIVAIASAVTLLAAGSILAAGSAIFGREYAAALQSRSLAVAKSLGMQLEHVLQFGIPVDELVGFDEQCRKAVANHPGIAYAMIADPEGRILFRSAPGASVAAGPLLPLLRAGREAVALDRDGGDYQAVAPVRLPDGRHAASAVVGFPAEAVSDRVGEMARAGIGISAVFVAVGIAILIAALSAFVTRPLGRLIAAVDRIRATPGDYSGRVAIRAGGEIGRLADAFDDMLERIRSRDAELAAHREHLEEEVAARTEDLTCSNAELQALNRRLEQAHNQLLQSEKMASLGLLAAGVAHEINNPISFVGSNLVTLGDYVKDFLRVIEVCERAAATQGAQCGVFSEIERLAADADIAGEKTDVLALIAESNQGIERVKAIVQNLRDFSRVDTEERWNAEDIHKGLESTLKVVWNEIKYTCEVKKEYGALPPVECLLSELNQVFLNLLVNAAQAVEGRGVITIRTGAAGDEVWLEIADTGKGISPKDLGRIFDPFFTTKPVGKGTGLGLSVSYSIVQKHHGRIEVESEVGKGTAFRVWLPVRQPADAPA